jgi:4-amino-4-deoxy-L-arabinose transferase-like glycosyltransferase
MRKGFNLIIKHWQLIFLAIFIFFAAYLRFANITRLEFFTYDQARDALFVKRMIVDHEFRLLGTQTSLPGMYLPPFYFYTIAPVLWLARLNPAGIDIYSALIGVLTVPLVYFVANKVFGRPAGVFSAGLFAVSPLVVELTRRAWNPNTLPFFILIAFYFVYRYYKEGKLKDFLLAFGFYGYCLSLHFGAWTLLPLFGLTWFYHLIKGKDRKVVGLVGAACLLFFFTCPLLLFELRHNFFLTSQAKVFFFDGGHIGPSGNFFEPLISSLIAIFTILISGKIMVGYDAPFEFSGKLRDLFLLDHPISVVAQKPFSISFQWWGLVVFLGILMLGFYYFYSSFKNKESTKALSLAKLPLVLLWAWIVWGVFASRMYSGKFFFFYYLFLFPAPILLFGFLGQAVWRKQILRPIALSAFLMIIGFHLKHTTVFLPSWRNFDNLKAVALKIAENAPSQGTFNLATIQKDLDRWDRNSVDYRYFVEAYGGKRALDWDPSDYGRADFLFVIDETGQSDPLISNIMEIKVFKPGKIVDQWQLENGVVVYKLSKGE